MRTLSISLLLQLTLVASLQARAPRETDFSVLVIPAQHGAIQIARDFETFNPVLLVSYDTAAPAETPFLHTWNGTAWMRLPAESYQSGNFLRRDPLRVIVVGQPTPRVERLVEQATHWSRREVLNIETNDPVEIINALGRIFDIRPRDWRWLANRYVLELEDLNRDTEHLSWYDTYRASDLPPPTSPFGRRRAPTEPEPGLRPIITLEPVEQVSGRDGAQTGTDTDEETGE
ncbi:MAG: hypothetical protein JJU05_16160 [Verrucomicrobia bacterium]|nr:hypothetical protein [Verrucomicrobiota bacterium]MCH8528692.1 hypothetical protein [Kiritimatiellia bacterium]